MGSFFLPNCLAYKNGNVFKPNSLKTAMLMGTIDLCRFIPLSVVLSWAGGHRVNRRQNLLAWFACTLCSSWRWHLMWCWNKLSLTSCHCFRIEWNLSNQGKWLSYWLYKKCWLVFGSLKMDLVWFIFRMMLNATRLFLLLVQVTLTFIQGHRSVGR